MSKNNQSSNSIEISDYIVKKTIGKGTFSKVKLGINKQTKQKVAIKILEKSKISDKDDLERIFREMSIIRDLDHLNVVQVFKIKETTDYFLIIMELCDSELFNYIVEMQRLSEEESAYFYYQLINGIEYIHSKGVVHRDLKPENLLLTDDHILKIIDFGLSNYYDGKLLSTPCGSPCYASPEMVSGNKYNGFRIDIWSSGIILFAMLCGYLPFEDEDNEKLFQKILDAKLHYPSHVSKTAKNLMRKILVTDPDERITIEEIKVHPFYLKGKEFFNCTHFFKEESKEIMPKSMITEPNKKLPISRTERIQDEEYQIKFKDYVESNIPSNKNNKINKVPKVTISSTPMNHSGTKRRNLNEPPNKGHSILVTDLNLIDHNPPKKHAPLLAINTVRNTITPQDTVQNTIGITTKKFNINHLDKRTILNRIRKPNNFKKKFEPSIGSLNPSIQFNIYDPKRNLNCDTIIPTLINYHPLATLENEKRKLPLIKTNEGLGDNNMNFHRKNILVSFKRDNIIAHPKIKISRNHEFYQKENASNKNSILNKGVIKSNNGIKYLTYKEFH